MCKEIEQYLIKDFSVSNESFHLKKDKEHGYYKTNPKPESNKLETYYKSSDYISHTNSKRSAFEYLYHLVRLFTVRRKVKMINTFNSASNNLLDIGCGTGAFISYAQKKGWTVKGIEPNEIARQNCEENIKKCVYEIHELEKLPKSSFDVISLWHVMEHLYDLEQQMDHICSLLKKGGKLVIALPNYKSFDAFYYKSYWAAFDVPRHLYHFSKSSIKSFFNIRGFSLIKTKPMFFDAFYVSILSERYKENKFSFLKGLLIGGLSNLSAIKTKEYSSKIYVFTKKSLNKSF